MKKLEVTRKAFAFIKRELPNVLDEQGLTLAKAFYMPQYGIENISMSGRTLRKVLNGEYVHINTIECLIEELGGLVSFKNGKIDIKDEQETTNTEATT